MSNTPTSSAQVAEGLNQNERADLPKCHSALRAEPAGQHDASTGETLDQKAENALLWCYRRLKNSYGRLPFIEEAVAGLRERTAAPRCRAEGGDTSDNSSKFFAATVAEGVALPPLDAEGLPPLPEPAGIVMVSTQAMRAFTAEQVRQAQREAYELGTRATKETS